MNKNRSISLIVEMLLIISIVLAVISIFIKGVILNEKTYVDILNKNNTYDQVKGSIYNKIDALLSAKNIKFDIKESIITEEDIKKEADNVISGFVEYLKTGENNVQPLDTSIYKQRVSIILHSILGGTGKQNTNDLSFNDNLQIQNTAYALNQVKFDNMLVVKDNSKSGQDHVKMEKLMTQSEAEAKVRELLKQKGLTEEQAIQKATQKGITEEQALKILAGYGITIDDNKGSEAKEAASEGSSDSSNASTTQGSSKVSGNSDKEESSNSQTNTSNSVSQTPVEKSAKSQLDNILNKLLDDASNSIEKEVEKINLNKILESNKFQTLAKMTSIIYKMFWIIIMLPIILMAILIKINGRDFNLNLKYVRNAFLIAGLILIATFFGAYVLKVYEKFNINIVYAKEVISYSIKYFLLVLSTGGIITFIIGLLMFMPMIKNSSRKMIKSAKR